MLSCGVKIMDLKYKPKHYLVALWVGLISLTMGVGYCVLEDHSWWWLIGTWAVYSLMAIVNSAGFHRLFSHRSYKTTPFWEWFFLICGTLSAYGSSLQWTVHHTQHHKYADTDRDPHNFKTPWDFFRVNYLVDRLDFASLRAIKHLLKKPGHKWVHEHYWLFPGSMILFLLLFFPTALMYLYLAPIGLVIFSAAMFNYVAHDDSGPNSSGWWTLVSSGEFRHDFHHDHPERWDLRREWYDVDPGAMLISLIRTGDGTWEP